LSKTTASSYSHAIFSDFSGDDGIQFDKGSSPCLTLAWVATREEEIQHNEGVLFAIKKKVGCRPTDELKYRSLRRHPANKEAALQLLQELKVDVSCVVVFKRAFIEEEGADCLYADPGTKHLVVLMQSFPFAHVADMLRDKYGEVRPRIVVDQLHWRRTQDTIIELVCAQAKPFARKDFQFRPSQATPLLQIADMFCGAVGEFCEGLEGQSLPPCHVCRNRNFKPRDCGWRRSSRRPEGFPIVKAAYPVLFSSLSYSHRIPNGLYCLPHSMNHKLEFVDCFLAGK